MVVVVTGTVLTFKAYLVLFSVLFPLLNTITPRCRTIQWVCHVSIGGARVRLGHQQHWLVDRGYAFSGHPARGFGRAWYTSGDIEPWFLHRRRLQHRHVWHQLPMVVVGGCRAGRVVALLLLRPVGDGGVLLVRVGLHVLHEHRVRPLCCTCCYHSYYSFDFLEQRCAAIAVINI